MKSSSQPVEAGAHLNLVVLEGRVSAPAEVRELPSGDELLTWRLVVSRPPDPDHPGHRVDTIDIACWTRRTQRTARTLQAEEQIHVEGALRRRFFATGAGRASRYEVEAQVLRRVTGARKRS